MSNKNRFAFFGGKIVPIEEAKVSVMTASFNYGTGIFEGIRAFWSEKEKELFVFRLKEHMDRFLRNSRFLQIHLPYSSDELCDRTLELLRREEYKRDAYIRPVAYKSSTVIGVRLHDLEGACTIFAIPFGEYIDKPDGARLKVSSWRRVDDNAIPARFKIVGAYVNSALAKSEAHREGYDDALMLASDGSLSEGSAANFMLVREGVLITPPVTDSILEGITRRTILEMAAREGIPAVERSVDRSELCVADEAFLCGTGVNVVPVTGVDGYPLGEGKPGAITTRLGKLYRRAVRGEVGEYRRYCTPVYGSA